MQLQKRIPAFLLALCLLLATGVTAYAYAVPDSTQTGSVTVTMTYGDDAVPGGTLTLYRVGDVASDDGNYSFVLTEAFAGSQASLDDVTSTDLVSTLETYITENSVDATASVAVGSDGKAVFPDLAIGLYLVIQTTAADGYEAAPSFLVTVPLYEDGAYLYDVDASPKVSTLSPTPVTPTTPTTPATTTTTTSLPQTGQLNWPVPVMASLGLALILLGLLLCTDRRRAACEA